MSLQVAIVTNSMRPHRLSSPPIFPLTPHTRIRNHHIQLAGLPSDLLHRLLIPVHVARLQLDDVYSVWVFGDQGVEVGGCIGVARAGEDDGVGARGEVGNEGKAWREGDEETRGREASGEHDRMHVQNHRALTDTSVGARDEIDGRRGSHGGEVDRRELVKDCTSLVEGGRRLFERYHASYTSFLSSSAR